MNESIFIKKTHSPVGPLTLACTDDSVCGLWFEDARFYLYGLPQNVIEADHPMQEFWRIGWRNTSQGISRQLISQSEHSDLLSSVLCGNN